MHSCWQSKTVQRHQAVFIALVVVVMLCLNGCSRQQYRMMADRDAYCLINSRQSNPDWVIPRRNVEANPQSRLADLNCPDCGPLPPDDPSASCYMRHPYNSKKPVRYWDQRGIQATIENGGWESTLPYDENGALNLDRQLAVDLGLIHSRDFQTQVEALYLTALQLSSNRFDFEVNWFGGSDGNFFASGDGANAVRNLSQENNLGFTRNFASGGELLTNLVNQFTWQLGGNGNSNFATSSLLFSLTQPLLRGAFRHVRTETLTQSERNLLYNVRSFARFRRTFYAGIVSDYLQLLNQTQAVRNEEENLFNLEANLEEHNALLELDLVSTVEVDQVFQQLQSGRLTLINSQQNLQTALDNFKFSLGLPARIEITFDEELLKPFQLNSKALLELQAKVDRLKETLLKFVPPDQPPESFVSETYASIKQLAAELKKLKPQVDEEFEDWVETSKQSVRTADEAGRADLDQQFALQKRVATLLKDLGKNIADADEIYEQPLSEMEMATDETDASEVEDWERLETLIAKRSGLQDRVASLVLLQTQIRLFLIKLNPLGLSQEMAVQIAIQRRLDLMNDKGAVTDAFRGVEIAADRLESDLSVSASAQLGTDNDNAFRFDSDANQYNLGVSFDGPLNRFNERNDYRLAQINYQQLRRQYMQAEDIIVNSVRLNLRQLRTNRFSFQIARQQLITATRLLEQTQFNLRAANSGDSSSTQDLLQALSGLRDAKNDLISTWISYETSRIAVFVDLESLQLDEQGVWINEQDDFGVVPQSGPAADGESENESTQRPSIERDTDEESVDREPAADSVDDQLPDTDIDKSFERFEKDLEPATPSEAIPEETSQRRGFNSSDRNFDRGVGGLLDLR